MPELHSGMTGEFRAFQASREIDLGRKLEEFIAQAVPDVLHIWVLDRLVEAGKAGCSVSEAAKGIDSPKSEVSAALERFEKLELARSTRKLMSKSYTFSHEGPKSNMALRLVKLWKHPQTHGNVLVKIMRPEGPAPGK